MIDNFLDAMNKQSEEETHSTINSYYFMIAIIGDVILQIVLQDALLAIFSLAFVFFWLRINTGSWFLAGVGFFEIFFSIPISWFIFSVVFQIKYFATLNSLAIFIVAAIGADGKQQEVLLCIIVTLSSHFTNNNRRYIHLYGCLQTIEDS